MKNQKNIIKMCNSILDALNARRKLRLKQLESSMYEFIIKSMEAAKYYRQLVKANENHWLSGSETISSRINASLDNFPYHVQKVRDFIKAEKMPTVKLSDLYAEIIQLNDEFGEIKIEPKEQTLSIITSPIALEDVALGPFEIRLFVDKIKSFTTESPYSVIALAPNPAANDNNVTHPHVSSKKLCEGDGCVPIKNAILQGRLADFFTIVDNILKTYNPDSPYVSLDSWEGTPCYECGYTISGDDYYFCEDCERDFCSECSTYCQICDVTVCLNCSYECNSCGQYICRRCMAICKECEEVFCRDCLNGDGICEECEIAIKQRKENSHEENEKQLQDQAHSAVYSDSLGEAAVHA